MSTPEYARERPLPASEDSERSILGAILLDNNCYGQTEGLTAEDFSLSSHKRIWGTVTAMFEDKFPVDIITLSETMRSQDQLEEIGGVPYLASLTDGVPGNIAHYVKIVKEKSQRRALIYVANNMIVSALEPGINLDKTLGKFQDQVFKIAEKSANAKDEDIFIDVDKFCNQYHAEVEWLVDGIIEVGTNGMMIGASGDGKSPCVRGLAVCLASGMDWLDMKVKRVRTALVSREDYAGTTSRFIKRFRQGNGIDETFNLGAWLWVHSRQQRRSLLLDKPEDLRLIINNLRRRQIQFCILDVLNVMHSKDENDNSEMRQVLSCVDHIRNEVGCQVLVLHHAGKAAIDNNSVVGAGRGATAMDGFAEFKLRIKTEDEDAGIRSMRFKTKAGEFRKPFFWKIRDLEGGGVTLSREDYAPNNGRRKAATA